MRAKDLPLKRKFPEGEYVERFLKRRGLWKEFRTSAVRRRYESEVLALKLFIRKKGIRKEFQRFRDAELLDVRLGGPTASR